MGGVFSMCQRDPFKPVKLCPIWTTARRRGVIIGVNYVGQPEQLQSCVNDAFTMRSFIKSRGYKDHEITLLVETATEPSALPTRNNIIAALKWLVEGAGAGDSLFFSFAGHGSQCPDLDGDEDDGLDETILPMDFKIAGHIVDDDLFTILVKPLPHGCRLTAVMDCCHSGTGLDLPFGLKGTRNAKNAVTRQRSTTMVPICSKIKKSKGDVLLFSGCNDDETSMDADDGDEITDTVRARRQAQRRKQSDALSNTSDRSSNASSRATPNQTPKHTASKQSPPGSGWKKRENTFCFGCGGEEALGVGSYVDDGETVKLSTFCNDCDEPTSLFCKVSGRKHVLHAAKGGKVRPGGKAGGALTTAFTTLLQDNDHMQLVDLVLAIRKTLRSMKYEQIVQVSGSKPFKMDSPFEI